MLFADKWGVSPLDILNKDIDDFIMLVNYVLSLNVSEVRTDKPKKEERIRVNDKTATGGWW